MEASEEKAKKSTIYTRTGDTGESSLYTGERRSKSDAIFEALGTVDELNSYLGLAAEHCKVAGNGLEVYIEEIQSRLFDVGSSIATPERGTAKQKRVAFGAEYTPQLEGWIDSIDAQLPRLTKFILPSGGLSSTHLHIARSVCRRAERVVVPLVQQGIAEGDVGKYLNRLSDFIFVAARYAAMKEGRTEATYKKGEGIRVREEGQSN